MTTIAFTVTPTNAHAPLGFEAWLDDHLIYDNPAVDQAKTIDHEFIAEEGPHELRFVLKHKTADHTRVDGQGQIISDSCLRISRVMLEGLDIGLILSERAVYRHDFNGTGQPTDDKFFDTMGCNGTVSLGFKEPVYLWLLENM